MLASDIENRQEEPRIHGMTYSEWLGYPYVRYVEPDADDLSWAERVLREMGPWDLPPTWPIPPEVYRASLLKDSNG